LLRAQVKGKARAIRRPCSPLSCGQLAERPCMDCSLFCDIGSGPSAGAGVSLLIPLLLKYYEGYSRHELLKLGRFSRGSSAVPVSHWHV
jgi:hypothetical protein